MSWYSWGIWWQAIFCMMICQIVYDDNHNLYHDNHNLKDDNRNMDDDSQNMYHDNRICMNDVPWKNDWCAILCMMINMFCIMITSLCIMIAATCMMTARKEWWHARFVWWHARYVWMTRHAVTMNYHHQHDDNHNLHDDSRQCMMISRICMMIWRICMDDMTDLYAYPWHVWYQVIGGGSKGLKYLSRLRLGLSPVCRHKQAAPFPWHALRCTRTLDRPHWTQQ